MNDLSSRLSDCISGPRAAGCSAPQPATRALSFTAALKYLKDGMKVRRAGNWGHVFMIKNAQVTFPQADGHLGGVVISSLLVFATPNNTYETFALCAADLLAEDWELL